MKRISRQISFFPITKETERLQDNPKPATYYFPKWFKKLNHTVRNEPFRVFNQTTNLTVKSCPPVIDALTTGYMITFPADIQVVQDLTGTAFLNWRVNEQLVVVHDSALLSSFPTPHGYSPTAYKFSGRWGIKTPKGISLLITQPFNRTDLVTYAMSAVVDTDRFPFFDVTFWLKEGFEGVLEANTPIAQLIPIQRNIWSSNVLGYSEDHLTLFSQLLKKIKNGYRTLFWVKKSYL